MRSGGGTTSGAVPAKYWHDGATVGLPNSTEQAANLLSQQIWCWGRDIESSGGNWLVRYGLQRVEKPVGSDAASLYRLDLSPASRIILRGFGVFCGDDRWGGVFLRRFGFSPQFTPETDMPRPAWLVDDLPSLVHPRADQLACCRRLLLTLVDWIRQYEVWIAERAGIAYRAATLRDWGERDGMVPAEQMTFAWRMLGVAVSDHPEQFILNHERQRHHA